MKEKLWIAKTTTVQGDSEFGGGNGLGYDSYIELKTQKEGIETYLYAYFFSYTTYDYDAYKYDDHRYLLKIDWIPDNGGVYYTLY